MMATPSPANSYFTQSLLKRKKRKRPPLGSGQRFDQLASKLATQPGVKNPDAVAASIGRGRLGPSKFNALAAKGKPGY